MSAGQKEGLIGFIVGMALLALVCCIGYGVGLILEKIIEKLESKGWTK